VTNAFVPSTSRHPETWALRIICASRHNYVYCPDILYYTGWLFKVYNYTALMLTNLLQGGAFIRLALRYGHHLLERDIWSEGVARDRQVGVCNGENISRKEKLKGTV